jgi:hypothetical protein
MYLKNYTTGYPVVPSCLGFNPRITGMTTWIFPGGLKANSLRKKMPQQLVSLSTKVTHTIKAVISTDAQLLGLDVGGGMEWIDGEKGREVDVVGIKWED